MNKRKHSSTARSLIELVLLIIPVILYSIYTFTPSRIVSDEIVTKLEEQLKTNETNNIYKAMDVVSKLPNIFYGTKSVILTGLDIMYTADKVGKIVISVENGDFDTAHKIHQDMQTIQLSFYDKISKTHEPVMKRISNWDILATEGIGNIIDKRESGDTSDTTTLTSEITKEDMESPEKGIMVYVVLDNICFILVIVFTSKTLLLLVHTIRNKKINLVKRS